MTQVIVSCELLLPFSFGSFKLYRGLGRIKAHEITARRWLFILANVAIYGKEYDEKKCQFMKLNATFYDLNNQKKYIDLFEETEKSFVYKHGDYLKILTTNNVRNFSKLFKVRNLLTNYEWEYSLTETSIEKVFGTYLGKD